MVSLIGQCNSNTPHDDLFRHNLAACPYCDLVMKRHNMEINQYSVCPRCHSKVEQVRPCCPHFLKWTVIAAMFFYIPANFYPLVAIEIAGKTTDTSVFNGVIFLIQQGNLITAAIILFCSLIVPTLIIGVFSTLLVSLHYNLNTRAQHFCVRLLVHLRQWSMMDIYLISFLVTMFKVKDMGEVQFQIGILAFVGLTLSINKLFIIWDKPALWRLVGQQALQPPQGNAQ